MLKVIFNNPGGELDSILATTEERAASALIQMVKTAGRLCEGDNFTVRVATTKEVKDFREGV